MKEMTRVKVENWSRWPVPHLPEGTGQMKKEVEPTWT